MNAPKMAATAIIINCSVNQKTKQKKKNLDCFADEKTETLGKERRFLCSLREKKNVYINVSGMWGYRWLWPPPPRFLVQFAFR